MIKNCLIIITFLISLARSQPNTLFDKNSAETTPRVPSATISSVNNTSLENGSSNINNPGLFSSNSSGNL